MALNFSTTLRNDRLNTIETTISTAPVLRIYTGSKPTACADAATGTLLVEMTLPSDWMAAASGGSKAKSGTWEDASANASGTAGYFRIWDSGVSTCHIQGTVTATGGGGDMELDNTSINATQSVTISTITADSDATGGTAALFKVTDSDGTEVFRGTVGTSGADLNLSSVAIDL